MYEAKYIIKKTKNPEGKISEFVTLKAKFRFGKEVVPINRFNVQRRTFFRYESNPLVKYLLEKEKLGYTEIKGTFKDDNRIVKIKPIWGLGFNLEAKINFNEIPLKEIIDLEALNEFVLTGEV